MTDLTKHIEYPPFVTTGTGVYSVMLNKDEKVQWHIDYSTGNPIVTGYTILIGNIK